MFSSGGRRQQQQQQQQQRRLSSSAAVASVAHPPPESLAETLPCPNGLDLVVLLQDDDNEEEDSAHLDESTVADVDALALLVQRVIQTRCTVGNFQPCSTDTRELVQAALDCAIACGLNAPQPPTAPKTFPFAASFCLWRPVVVSPTLPTMCCRSCLFAQQQGRTCCCRVSSLLGDVNNLGPTHTCCWGEMFSCLLLLLPTGSKRILTRRTKDTWQSANTKSGKASLDSLLLLWKDNPTRNPTSVMIWPTTTLMSFLSLDPRRRPKWKT